MAEMFGMGSLGLGGLSGVMDTMELVRKTWSQVGTPSSFAPTMDIDELDKRIADLKTVEQWLNLNLSMLHGTIQAMEIQRGTLTALKAFGESLGEGGAGVKAAASALAALAAVPRAMARARADDAPTPTPATPAAAAPPTTAAHANAPGAADESRQGAAPAHADEAQPGARPGLPDFAAGLSKAAASAVNPAAWWNLLQSQFNQVAQAALAGTDAGKDTAGAAQPAQATSPAAARARRGASASRGSTGGKRGSGSAK